MKNLIILLILISCKCFSQQLTVARINFNDSVHDVIIVELNEVKNHEGTTTEEKVISFCRRLYGNKYYYTLTDTDGLIRKNYAGKGYSYDIVKDAFIEPKPKGDYTFNETTCKWGLK